MSPAKVAAILLGAVIAYALILGGITFVVILASSVADHTDVPDLEDA